VIIVNLLGLTTGGGRVIVESLINDYIPLLKNKPILLIVNYEINQDKVLATSSFHCLRIPRPFGILSDQIFIFFLILIRHGLGFTDTLLNFSDIPVICFARQIFFFDWAYAIASKSSWGEHRALDFLFKSTKKYVYSILSPFIDSYICQTDYVKLGLIKSGVSPCAISVIPIGAASLFSAQHLSPDSSSVSAVLSRARQYSNVLLCPNSYNSHKGFDHVQFLANSEFLQSTNSLLILLLDESTVESLFPSFSCLSNSNVMFLGPVTRADMTFLYDCCSIVFNPSQLESFGFPYYESFLHGKRQVVPRLPHIPSFARIYQYNNIRPSDIIIQLHNAIRDSYLFGPLDRSQSFRQLNYIVLESQAKFAELLSDLA